MPNRAMKPPQPPSAARDANQKLADQYTEIARLTAQLNKLRAAVSPEPL